jgi:hypothetical protein
MKKMLVALALGFGLSVFGQQEIRTSFQTTEIETSVMTKNYSTGDWNFSDNNDLQPYDAFWTFRLGENGKGGYISSGDIIYSVFDWETTENGVLVNFYAHKRNEDGTVIVVVRPDGKNSMTFFLPESNISLTFHEPVR